VGAPLVPTHFTFHVRNGAFHTPNRKTYECCGPEMSANGTETPVIDPCRGNLCRDRSEEPLFRAAKPKSMHFTKGLTWTELRVNATAGPKLGVKQERVVELSHLPGPFPLTGSNRADKGLCHFQANAATSPKIAASCLREMSPGSGMVSSPVPHTAE
jgi:hypothetical protein